MTMSEVAGTEDRAELLPDVSTTERAASLPMPAG
jgi:hypothetical protein